MDNIYYLNLYTDDATTGKETPYNCTWTVDLDFKDVYNKVQVALESVSFPNNYAPINSNNYTINVLESSNGVITAVSVNLTVGGYSGLTLATEIGDKLSAASTANTYTATYDIYTKKMTIESTVPFIIQPTSNSFRVIGFPLTQLNTMTYNLTHEGESPINVSGSQMIYITTDLGTQNKSSSLRTDILTTVQIDRDFGCYIYYNSPTTNFMPMTLVDFSSITIRLYDEYLNDYALPEGSNVNYVLKFKFN